MQAMGRVKSYDQGPGSASSRNSEQIMQALRSTLIRAGSALSCARSPGSCAVQGILGSRAVSWGLFSSSRSCNFRNIISTISRTAAINLHATLLPSVSMPIKRFSTATIESAKQPMFAVIIVGGKQYKVCENDCIVTEKLIGKRVGKLICSILIPEFQLFTQTRNCCFLFILRACSLIPTFDFVARRQSFRGQGSFGRNCNRNQAWSAPRPKCLCGSRRGAADSF